MNRFDWASFFSNILSVVLGIFITFGIQGVIDRRAERKDVSSALELVKEELVSNRSSLQEVIDIIALEKDAAVFIRDNKSNFSKIEEDSLIVKNAVLGEEYFFTVTDDALELLKSSSLFQKINDKNLALSIIKAYDYLEASSQAFNTHEKNKASLSKDANVDAFKKASLRVSGAEYQKAFYSSKEADFFLNSVIGMSDDSIMVEGIQEIDATVASIETRLKGRTKPVKMVMETTMGDIKFRLYDETPLHRDNFIKLAEEHYFDSLLFHRVIEDFMIQGGDPNSKNAEPGQLLGDGDPGYTVPAEFRLEKGIYHKRGVIGAAREGDDVNPEQASCASQFYFVWGKVFDDAGLDKTQERLDRETGGRIKLTPEMREYYKKHGGTPHLDGQYTVFGEITKGRKVVEAIQKVATDENDRPLTDVRILRVYKK